MVPLRSEAAEAMWMQFASLWKSVDLDSTNYTLMQQPLLSGEVWIGFDHVARVLGALRRKPDEFVAFPVPAGPKRRGYVPALAGLAVPKGAVDMSAAMALIDYLTKPETQIVTARSTGFVPVVKAPLPPDLAPGLKLAAAAMERMQSEKDALAALLPIGLEFEEAFMDTFQLVVLRGQKPHEVLDLEAERLNT